MTGDHHLWRKSYAYEASARIPFLVRWPERGAIGGARGVTIDRPVELRDVLPTFLDAAGAPAVVGLDGRSILPLLRGEGGGWRDKIDLEHDVCYSKRNHWNALTDGKWKYIFHVFDGSEQLFDLRNDPGEERDLAGESSHAGRLGAWRQDLVAHFAERGEEFVREGRLVKRPKRKLYSPHFPGTSTPS